MTPPLKKKADYNESLLLTLKERSPWKRESGKYQLRILQRVKENRFKLMETETQENPLKQKS